MTEATTRSPVLVEVLAIGLTQERTEVSAFSVVQSGSHQVILPSVGTSAARVIHFAVRFQRTVVHFVQRFNQQPQLLGGMPAVHQHCMEWQLLVMNDALQHHQPVMGRLPRLSEA